MASDGRDSVFELQRALLQISRVDPDIPSVNPDGIYGSTTVSAVRAFQDKYMGGGNGLTDFFTWKMIIDRGKRAERLLSRGDGIFPFDIRLKDGILSEGDRCPTVGILRLMLKSISQVYAFLEDVGEGDIFDRRLKEAVIRLQRIHGLNESGDVDLETWNAIALSYNRGNGTD